MLLPASFYRPFLNALSRLCIRHIFPLLLLLFCVIFNQKSVSAGNDAPKDYYLISKLKLDKLSTVDKVLIDSMLTIYHNCTEDSCKIAAISTIVEESWDENVWPRYNEWIHDFTFEQLGKSNDPKTQYYLKKALAGSLNNMGYLSNIHGDAEVAIQYFEKSINIYKTINDKSGLASTLINLGHIYDNRGIINKALDCYYESLSIQEELENTKGIATALNGIGFIYYKQDEAEKALEYYNKSLAIRQKIDDQYGIATCLNNIGLLFKDTKEYDKALSYYRQCISIDEKLNNQSGIATSLVNIGTILKQQKNYNEALIQYNKSLVIQRELENKNGIAHSLDNIAGIQLAKGQFNKAEQSAQSALKLANQLNYPKLMRNVAQTLTSIYEAKGNWKQAYHFHSLYVKMKDSINSEETRKQSIHKGYQYEYNKQFIADSIKNAEFKKVQEAKVRASELEKENAEAIATTRKQQAFFLLGGLIVLIIFAFILYKRLKLISKQKLLISQQKKEVEEKSLLVQQSKDQIAEQNKQVMDSIHYAKRIQQALLRNENHLNLNFRDQFIYFRPKEVISGDFYWMTEQHGYIYAAVGDCTGHGVPGAMLTMLGTSILNEILAREQRLSPSTILNELRDRIISELSQQDEKRVKDGMDIALIKYSLSTKELLFSGANRPLWHIRDDEMTTLKGDKQCIGHNFNPIPFQDHILQLQENDRVYLTSDGYIDQFGGPSNKKLRISRFVELLHSIKDKTMTEQIRRIDDFFGDWKGNNEQTDDVCVMGILF